MLFYLFKINILFPSLNVFEVVNQLETDQRKLRNGTYLQRTKCYLVNNECFLSLLGKPHHHETLTWTI